MPTIQIAPPLTWLDRLNRQLDDTLARTDRTITALDTVRSAGEQAASAHESSMQRIGAAADSAVAAASSSADQVAAAGQRAETAAAGSSASVQRHAEEAEGTLAQMAERAEQEATALDDVFERLQLANNDWTGSFLAAIEAAKAGIIPLEEVIRTVGDASAVIDGESKRIAQIFAGLDLGQWQQEFQDLIRRVREGSAELSEVEQKLAQSQHGVAQRLLDVIRLVREGSVSLDQLRRLVDEIAQTYQDSELDNLAQAVLAGLKDGSL